MPISEEFLNTMDRLSPTMKQEVLNAAAKAKENQKFFILIPQNALDSYTSQLLNSFVDGYSNKIQMVGFLERPWGEKADCGILAFGALNAHYQKLTPIIHLTPTAAIMADHLISGRSDFALQFPDEVALTHGSEDQTVFSQMHDLFHAAARRERKHSLFEVLKFARAPQVNPSVRAAYQQKMSDGRGETYPRFVQAPTTDEMVAYLLDRLLGEAIDAGSDAFNLDAFGLGAGEEIFQSMVKDLFYRELSRLIAEFPIDRTFKENVKSQLLKRLNLRRFAFDGLASPPVPIDLYWEQL